MSALYPRAVVKYQEQRQAGTFSRNPMRILVTNDDGIDAPGISILKDIAGQLAGQDGEVWTVAPSTEQSGTGHSVSLIRPFLIKEISPRRFAVEGTPADCVLAGIYEVMPPLRPDLVLSGINRGNNSGENTLYSGTIGAAIEASLHGITGIALSQYYGPDNRTLANPFEAAQQYALDAVSAALRCNEDPGNSYPLFFNVNFPPCAARDVLGIRAAPQGYRSEGQFRVEQAVLPNRRKFLCIRNGPQDSAAQPGTDIAANLQNFVSITPMRADLTDHETMSELAMNLPCPQ